MLLFGFIGLAFVALGVGVSAVLAAEEYAALTAQLRELSAEDWRRATCCAGWDVHAMVCHVVGMAEFAASPIEQARQALKAKRRGGLFIDALTAVQVDKHLQDTSAELVEGHAGWRIQTWNSSSGVASQAGSPPP